MTIFLAMLFSFGAFASVNPTDMYEKTFPRDNSYCQLAKVKTEFSIRGFNKFTEPKDRGYGEFLFLKIDENRIYLEPTHDSGYFRFFRGESPLCTKGAAYLVNDNSFALLLQKANRPYKDKLIVQLFESKTGKPLKSLVTEYLTDKTLPAPGGFYFRNNGERQELDMGTFMWEEKRFTYQDRDFQEWYLYDKAGFSLSPKMTFEQSPYKAFFTDEADFLKAAGWSASDKKFTNKAMYVAVNHEIRKDCVLMLPKIQKLTGTETGWRCRNR